MSIGLHRTGNGIFSVRRADSQWPLLVIELDINSRGTPLASVLGVEATVLRSSDSARVGVERGGHFWHEMAKECGQNGKATGDDAGRYLSICPERHNCELKSDIVGSGELGTGDRAHDATYTSTVLLAQPDRNKHTILGFSQ